jgi:hypothetical protein
VAAWVRILSAEGLATEPLGTGRFANLWHTIGTLAASKRHQAARPRTTKSLWLQGVGCVCWCNAWTFNPLVDGSIPSRGNRQGNSTSLSFQLCDHFDDAWVLRLVIYSDFVMVANARARARSVTSAVRHLRPRSSITLCPELCRTYAVLLCWVIHKCLIYGGR